MTHPLRLAIGSLALTAAFAAGPRLAAEGNYVEARTADVYTGPCFANSEINLVGDLAVFGWQINKGSVDGVSVDGLSVAAAVKASSTLGAGRAFPVKSVLLVDERASLLQREALKKFARHMAGDLLQDIVRVDAMPIQFEVTNNNIHGAKVTLTAGTMARIQTRGIQGGDHVCTNETAWYEPLTKLSHAMPAYSLEHEYKGDALNVRWASPEKRSAFVGTFHVQE